MSATAAPGSAPKETAAIAARNSSTLGLWFWAGVNLRRQRPSDARVRLGVRRVLSDPSFRTAASRIATEMASAAGAVGFAAAIDDVVAHHPRAAVDGATPAQDEVA